MEYHKPVLLSETIEHLKVNKGSKYIDATLGDAGHSLEIMKNGGLVLGIEINQKALDRAVERIKNEGFGEQFTPCLGNFKDIDKIASEKGFDKVAGIIYDLGYSSYELEDSEFGLSFYSDQPLDMRLDKNLGVTAADLVNTLSEADLSKMLFEYSDERMSRKFAQAIVKNRNLKKFQTTKELADLLKAVASPAYEHGRIHPATRTFQALRIVVNDELENLRVSLPRAARLLLPGGRMLIISFHSMEDKVAKQFGHSAQPKENMYEAVTKKPIQPSEKEIAANSRSRSAKLRIFEKHGKN